MGDRTVTATVGGSATFMLKTEGGVGGICTTPTDKLEEEEGEEGGVVRTEEPLQPTKYAHYRKKGWIRSKILDSLMAWLA